MGEPRRINRSKTYSDIEKQADRAEYSALKALPENPTQEDYDRYLSRVQRIQQIRSRYLGNIRNSERFQAARRLFDREGMDVELRADLKAMGVDTYDQMYNTPYSQSTYMRNRRRRR